MNGLLLLRMLRSRMLHDRATDLSSRKELGDSHRRGRLFSTLSFYSSLMQTHQGALRYSSYLFSAPVFAAPVFVILGILESADVLDIILCVDFATILPIVGIVSFARSRRLDYDIPERNARTGPFVVANASFLSGFLLLLTGRAPVLLTGLMLAYLINTSVMSVITLAWKISIHAAGITGPLTFLMFKLGPAWSLLYLLVVPVGLIRLRMRQHTVLQVIAGAVLSAALTWAQIILLVPLIQSQT